MPTVAELLDTLFKTHRKPDGQEYSCQEVARALHGEIDASYIAKVRRGAIKNPGRDALKMLCVFFRVPSSYFFPDLEALVPEEAGEEKQMELLRTALRSMALTPDVQAYLEGLVVALQQQGSAPLKEK